MTPHFWRTTKPVRACVCAVSKCVSACAIRVVRAFLRLLSRVHGVLVLHSAGGKRVHGTTLLSQLRPGVPKHV